MMKWPKDRLTRFEVARIISARALQIALGAPVLIKTESKNPREIAREEFIVGVLPLTVKRTLPTGETEIIEIKKAIKNWIKERGI